MVARDLNQLLERVRSGELPVEQAAEALHALGALGTGPGAWAKVGMPSAAPDAVMDLGYARVDLDRERRLGLPEVVFGEPKTAAQIIGIVQALALRGQSALVTRLDAERASEVQRTFPKAVYHAQARCLTLANGAAVPRLARPVAIVTAGTGDLPVAEEAAVTLELAGETVLRVTDVGVAGLHRLLSVLPELERVSAVVCVAGMEGALPSVLGGLVRVPVFAVPTSVGYGISAGGFAALAGMLSSCSAGISVVNIDNGFGAAMAVLRMAMAVSRERAEAEGGP
jgi:NCAIR mutase (PurE)-related protein